MLTLAQLPTGFTPLAVIVQVTGDIDIYIEPICGTTTLFRLAGAPDQEATLRRIRQLRDKLSQTSDGQALIQVVEAMTRPSSKRLGRGPTGRIYGGPLLSCSGMHFMTMTPCPYALKS